MDTTYILWFFGILIAIISYFLKQKDTKIEGKADKEAVNDLKLTIQSNKDLISEHSRLIASNTHRIDSNREQSDMMNAMLKESIEELKLAIKELTDAVRVFKG